MSESLNLYQRLVKVMASMGAIGKTGKVEYGERFAYHKIDDIDEKLRHALIEHGVVCVVTDIENMKLEYFVEKDRGGKERSAWYAECAITIELINADNPDERRTIKGWGQGLDYSDKATGKAMSYATKSAYLASFHLRGQPDNEEDNIAAPKADAEPAELDAASQSWVDAINQADEPETLVPLGAKLAKEPQQVMDAAWPFYYQMWAKIIKTTPTKEKLDELGFVLAAEPKHVSKAVRDDYKRRLVELKK